MEQGLKKLRGFTLIELMIVIVIVALLVTLAVPAYRDFTIRAKVTECINGAAVPKTQISEYFQSTGFWPPNPGEAGITQTAAIFNVGLSQFCKIHFYNNGEGDFAVWVDVESIDASLIGQLIIPVLSPTLNGSGGTDWTCTRGFTESATIKYLPSGCRGPNIFGLEPVPP